MAAVLVSALVAGSLRQAEAAEVDATSAAPRNSVFAAGSAVDYGSTADLTLNAPLNDIVATASGRGYWLLGGDGGVFAYGDAPFYGSMGGQPLNAPVLSMAPTPTGNGYWFVASDGGMFAFGDAEFYGSMGGQRLNAPVVGMVPTKTGKGYWLVASDGGTFAFGDAAFFGSTGGRAMASPVVGMAAKPDGSGYWLVDRDGRVYGFGATSGCCGYQSSSSTNAAVDIQSAPDGKGYWILRKDGTVASFGTAPSMQPNLGALSVGEYAVGVASTADGRGLWVATTGRYRSTTAAPGSSAYAFMNVDSRGRPGRWNPCEAIEWRFNPADAPTGDALGFVSAAVTHLGAVTGMSFVYAGTTTTNPNDPPRDRGIVIGWGRGLNAPVAGLGGAAGYFTSGGLRYTAGGVLLNASMRLGLDWTDGWGPILLHELGHVMGLDHVNDPNQLMYPSVARAVDYAAGDLAGLYELGPSRGCL
ncbi:MAG: matrixin family metalloprotease [Acidimicrobiia bacterium]